MKKALKALPAGNLEKIRRLPVKNLNKNSEFLKLLIWFFSTLKTRRHKTASIASTRPQRRVRGMGSMKKALNILPAGNLKISNSKKYADYQIRIWTKIPKFLNFKSDFFFNLNTQRHKTPNMGTFILFYLKWMWAYFQRY